MEEARTEPAPHVPRQASDRLGGRFRVAPLDDFSTAGVALVGVAGAGAVFDAGFQQAFGFDAVPGGVGRWLRFLGPGGAMGSFDR